MSSMHGHAHDRHAHHEGSLDGSEVAAGNKRRVLIAASLTCGFMIVEAVGGILTGSLALLADAGHMLTDSVALILAYAAYRVSERPGTSRMTYGFDRLKILVAYTNGLTVLAIALWIVAEAVQRFLTPAPILGGAMLVVATMGLAVNVVVFLTLHGGDRASLNLRGAILHVLGDLLGSVAAIAAALIILATGWYPADPLLSVLVALLLLWSAGKLIRESGLILLEGAPPHVDRNDVAMDLGREIDGVSDIHHMHVWSLDDRQLVATLHARVQPGADPERVVSDIKTRLAEAHGIRHATVEAESGRECPDTVKRRADGTA